MKCDFFVGFQPHWCIMINIRNCTVDTEMVNPANTIYGYAKTNTLYFYGHYSKTGCPINMCDI